MNFLNTILSIFNLSTNYESQTSYRIKHIFTNLEIDLKDIEYENCPLKIHKGSYQANKLSIKLNGEKIWHILDAKLSIRYLWVGWDPINERVLVGESRKFKFRTLRIIYNGMDKETFLLHISSLENVFAFNKSHFISWIEKEVNVFDKVNPTFRSINLSDKRIKFRFDFVRNSRTPFRITVDVSCKE